MYHEYLSERFGQKVETFGEDAFFSYSISDDNIHLHHWYVDKNKRKEGYARRLIEKFYKIAYSNNCKWATTCIEIGVKGQVQHLKHCLFRGFEPYHLEGKIIYLRKSFKTGDNNE